MARLLPAIVLLLLLTISTGTAQQEEEETEGLHDDSKDVPAATNEIVLTLTQDNFTEYVQDSPIILVEFYAPWCGHCKQLAPEYEAAAEKLKEHNIPLAKVDATANEDLARRYEIQGYPTMKVFRQGNPYDYDGPRRADGIITYMIDQARPDWAPPPDRVLVLTQDNFAQTVEESSLILVEFYAPWCGHCKQLAPEYTKAANSLHDLGLDIKLAKVDATVETDLASQYEVQGFPTLKMFRYGRVSEYKGPRQANGIVDYMHKQSRPPTTPLKSSNEISTYVKYQQPVVVGFFESLEDPGFEKYSDAANEGRETSLKWLHCTDPQIAKAHRIKFGTIVVLMPRDFYNKHEKKIKTYEGPLDEISPEELMRALRELATPLVGMRTRSNSVDLYSRYPLFVGYLSLEDEEDSFGYWKDKLVLPLAVKYPGMRFALSDETEFKHEIQGLQLHDRGDDLLVGIQGGEKERYAYQDDDVSLDSVAEFIDAYLAGEIQPIKKSQAPPAKHAGPVKVVVGTTFKKIVEDPQKDVLIEFYAPWCGHCKALEPVYTSLAKKFKKNDKLVIAKIDGTENEFPEHYQVSGFPTIYFVPAGESPAPVLFEGERELKKMVKFLKKHAVYSLGGSKTSEKKKNAKDEL